MKKNLSKKARKVGFWLDLDWGLKRELETYAGCQRYAEDAGWRLVLDPSLKRLHKGNPERFPYDGILTRVTQPIADAARKAEIPLVNLWLNSPVRNVPTVVPDFEASGVMAAEHLMGRGLRSFGYLGSRRPKDAELQFKGFRTTLLKAGFRCSSYRHPHTLLDRDAPLWEKFEEGLEKWIDTWRPPIGLFIHQDVFCRFVIDLCGTRGLSVPGDVAIVGSSNEATICEKPSPSLSSIDFGHERRGYQAAALLDRMMNGEPGPASPVLVVPGRLIPRQSSDIFAADDPVVARAMRFIAENSNRMLEVPEVTAEVGTSRRTLERKFRASVGHSIAQEMIRLRLNRAKRRLADPDVLLKTVAQELGFPTASHFSKVFTRVIGISPSEYKEKRREASINR